MKSLFVIAVIAGASLASASQARLQYLPGGFGIMVSDAAGNLYVVGASAGTGTNFNVLVTKLDSVGRTVYTKTFGGSSHDGATAATVDPAGNLYVVGSTDSSDFPLVNPLPGMSIAGPTVGFITKIDPSGTRLLFSSKLGGQNPAGSSVIRAIALDPAGNAYLTGGTGQADFPISADAFQKQGPRGGVVSSLSSAFVTKIPASLDRIEYSTFLSGTRVSCGGDYCCSACSTGLNGLDAGYAVAVDPKGVATVTGYANTNDFPTTAGAFQQTCYCDKYGGDVFVSRLNADGSALIWSTLLGTGGGTDPYTIFNSPASIALDASGNVLVAGVTAANDFPTTAGALQPVASQFVTPGKVQAFLTWFNSSGSAILASTYLGGSGLDNYLSGMALDSQGNIWVSGDTDSPDFPALPTSLQLGNSFLAKLPPQLDRLLEMHRLPKGTAGTLALEASGTPILLGESGFLLYLPAGFTGSPAVLGVANSAGTSVSPLISPGAFLSFYGVDLGPQPPAGAVFDTPNHIATSLAGVTITFDGVPAPLLYAGPNQINAVVPFELAGHKSSTVHMTAASGLSQDLTLPVVDATPFVSWYPSNLPGLGTLSFASALNQDGTLNSPTNPAHSGSIVTIFANGAGVYSPALTDGTLAAPPLAPPVLPVQILGIQGQLQILYAGGAPGLVSGALQVNFRLPQISISQSSISIQLQVGSATSTAVSLFTSP